MPLDEVVLDYQVIGETVTPEGAARLRIVVVAARESMVSRVVEAVRGAGLRPEGIDLNAFALVRTLSLPADSAESARVYCHLAGVTNLAIAIGPICLFTRPLSTAWAEDDEQAAAAALAEEIRLSVDFYMAQPEARWVGEVVLSGPGAERPKPRRAPRRDDRRAGLGRRAARPAAVDADSRWRGPLPPHHLRRPRSRSGGMNAVNLLPEKHRPRKPTGGQGRGSYIALGVLGAVLVGPARLRLHAQLDQRLEDEDHRGHGRGRAARTRRPTRSGRTATSRRSRRSASSRSSSSPRAASTTSASFASSPTCSPPTSGS